MIDKNGHKQNYLSIFYNALLDLSGKGELMELMINPKNAKSFSNDYWDIMKYDISKVLDLISKNEIGDIHNIIYNAVKKEVHREFSAQEVLYVKSMYHFIFISVLYQNTNNKMYLYILTDQELSQKFMALWDFIYPALKNAYQNADAGPYWKTAIGLTNKILLSKIQDWTPIHLDRINVFGKEFSLNV